MKLFENEKLTKVNERIKEIVVKRDALNGEITIILQAIEDSVQAYAMGDVDEETVKKVEDLLRDKSFEVKQLDEMLQRVKGVRKTIAFDSIPLVRQARVKKVEAVDNEWNEVERRMKKAQAEVFLCYHELSKIKGKANSLMRSYDGLMLELGNDNRNDRTQGKSKAFQSFDDIPTNPNPSYFGEEVGTQVSYSIPDWATKMALTGYLPDWVKRYKETGKISFEGDSK
ncbi:hypothetical protein MKZ26_20130 [Sporosarcina sp. FSL K6-6792]|uniref:hypothetical protein n=1 Tax=Sporosarcina sp. FSL K6-6792 TaxID=2921559 RepID=UPI0030FCA6AC